MNGGLKRLADGLLELVYPLRAECMGCGTRAGFPRPWLCEDCRQRLAERWVGALPPEGPFDGAAYAYRYGEPAGGMVRSLKYRGVARLSTVMGRAMVKALEGIQPTGADGVVSVPMHKKRLAERGVDHAGLLARAVAGQLELPVLDGALERTRNTPQQARLEPAQRRRNMDGAIALRGDVAGRRILLVDDVRTTGATANACATALREGGASAVYLLCFAIAGEKDDDRQ